jgi:hypothetical protein
MCYTVDAGQNKHKQKETIMKTYSYLYNARYIVRRNHGHDYGLLTHSVIDTATGTVEMFRTEADAVAYAEKLNTIQ